MIDLSHQQSNIEISEHKKPMAFAVPPMTNDPTSAPLAVNQTAQGQETAALGTQGTETQTPSSAIEHIEECICDNTDMMRNSLSKKTSNDFRKLPACGQRDTNAGWERSSHEVLCSKVSEGTPGKEQLTRPTNKIDEGEN